MGKQTSQTSFELGDKARLKMAGGRTVAAGEVREQRVEVAGLLHAVADRLRAHKAMGMC